MAALRLCGVALVALAAVGAVSAAHADTVGASAPLVLLLCATFLIAAVAMLAGADPMLRQVLPALLACACLGAVLLTPGGLSGEPIAGPLHYGNANGALCLLGAWAALTARAATESRNLASGYLAVALLGVVLAKLTGSLAATALAALLVLTGLLCGGRARSRAWIGAAVAMPTIVLVGTLGLGATYDAQAPRTGRLDRVVDASLTTRRVVLWSESIDLADAHPLLGVGPGQFAFTAPTARLDRDARWSHSLVLQTAAESGWLAASSLLVLLGAAFWRLAQLSDQGSSAPIGALGLSAVLSQASIDYIAHFPQITLLAAGLLGLALCRVRPPEPGSRR